MIDSVHNRARLIELGENIISEISVASRSKIIGDYLEQEFNCSGFVGIYDVPNSMGDINFGKREDIPESIMAAINKSVLTKETYIISNDSLIPLTDILRNDSYNYANEIRVIASPITFHSHLFGVCVIECVNDSYLTSEVIENFSFLVSYVALILQASYPIIEEQNKYELLSLMRDVSAQITKLENIDELSEKITNIIQDTFDYYYVAIYTIESDTNTLYCRSRSGASARQTTKVSSENEGIADLTSKITIQIGEGIIGNVAKNGEAIIANDVSNNSTYRYEVALPETKSEAAFPIKIGGKIIGVLDVQSNTKNAFRDEDLLVLNGLSDNIAIALRNSYLYRSEQWRRRIADGLGKVAGLLSADISLEEVLNRILNELINTIPSMVAVIWLSYDSDDLLTSNSELRLSAIHFASNNFPNTNEKSDNLNRLLGLGIDELIKSYGLESSVKSWLLESMKSNSPLIRNLDSSYEPIGAYLEFNQDYSAVAAPLRIGDRLLGVLTLLHDIPGRYGENAQLLSATFASHAAVAIENTRLYEAAHDQAWVSTVLLQITQSMQSIDNLDELLHTIVQILPDLIGSKSCAILLWDENAASFIPGTAYGFSDEQINDFQNWYIGESEIQVFDNLIKTKAPVVIDQGILSEINADLFFNSFNFSESLFLLFPMISQNEIVGAILIDLNNEVNQLQQEISLWDEKVLIVQGVANQTAIAVENIQLSTAQEEEAYVSVALLQVAQAVVSSNNLDEILSTIVRITPILVGIRRSIIFLWDDAQKIFRMSQTYGFSRDEISEMYPLYSPGEFPLLDNALQNNKIVYYPNISPLKPAQWTELSSDEIILVDNVNLTNEENSKATGLFQSDTSLLMGFPLAIKEKVLGLMLIEEVEQKSTVPSPRIRERRFEIITGITQQAAVAIQNDILQRDVLERERLEREMQLAREIQSTFLPEQLPVMCGWDIDVRWQPARQVGGDFYDIFELPNDQLGIVVADVADKGMPAALYMMLVRTLIKSAIQDYYSPIDVLQKVNNLLVPDSKKGMFVTLVYAVLSIKTGRLVYANAGHNPPLSFNLTTGEIIEHGRSAMALGVFQDIEINESEMTLNHGDLVLFYTDGITEAFSNMDEIFGLERLKNIMLQSKYDSAASLLDQIEWTVIEFSDGLSQADDITLLALFRQ